MQSSLADKKVLLGITGSIAAYKSIILARLLIKAGAEVRVVMTNAAKDFVSPLVLSTLTRNQALIDIAGEKEWANHVMLGRWADVFMIAPASCNTIAKMANGLCDNLLLAVYLSATCPVMLAPAMDEDMWKHPSTKSNLKQIEEYGIKLLQVNSGELASGLVGEGRMIEPDEIFAAITQLLVPHQPLKGVKAIVTAGPTHEPIDPVRFFGNQSSGLMGIEIANALARAGAEITLILGPSSQIIPSGIETLRVTTASEMFEATKAKFSTCNIAVMAAAVADFRPEQTATEKIKKDGTNLQLTLVPNPDILAWCGKEKSPNQIVVGFALETSDGEENAKKKLSSKNADIIILNTHDETNAAFGSSINKISIFDTNGNMVSYPQSTKKELAIIITNTIINKLNEKQQR